MCCCPNKNGGQQSNMETAEQEIIKSDRERGRKSYQCMDCISNLIKTEGCFFQTANET